MRKKIYEIINSDSDSRFSTAYAIFMMTTIVISLVPLAFHHENRVFFVLDKVCVGIFAVDYLLRLITADYKFEKKSVISFLRYPVSFMAVIDLISILPSLTPLNIGFKVLRIFRMARLLRVFRVFRVFRMARYSRSIRIMNAVIKDSREPLIAVSTLAAAYIVICALVIMNVEPGTFKTFFDAVYWAALSLTTVGYGDIYPVSILGRLFTVISSLLGIAIVALPSGIITAGYMKQLNKIREKNGKSEKTDEPDSESELN